jgi:putative ABC transport system ATP-binding protein
MSIITAKNLIKTFIDGDKETHVLKGIDFKAEKGEWIAIMGRSGAGKSTFLYQLSLLDEPTSGEIFVLDREIHTMKAEEKTGFRLNELGYVFQDYALLPDLTAIENVAVPIMMQGKSKSGACRFRA